MTAHNPDYKGLLNEKSRAVIDLCCPRPLFEIGVTAKLKLPALVKAGWMRSKSADGAVGSITKTIRSGT